MKNKVPFQLPHHNAMEVFDKGSSIVTLPDGSKIKITIDDLYVSSEDVERVEKEMKNKSPK